MIWRRVLAELRRSELLRPVLSRMVDEVDEGGAVADLLCLELAPWSTPWTPNWDKATKRSHPDDQGYAREDARPLK